MIQPLVRLLIVTVVGLGVVAPQVSLAQEEKADEGPDLGYVLVPKSAKRIKAVLTIEMKAPNLLADEWSIYVCQIPELPGQFEAKTALFPRGRVVRDLSESGRPIVVTQIPSQGEQFRKGVKARAEYETILLERRLEKREADDPPAPAVPPLDPRARRLWLSNAHQFDYNHPRFKAWLEENKLRREAGESEVNFARKAFLAVRQGFTHYEGEDAEHMASKVCEVGKSDYAGLTAVFVSALRANGIPTRILAGRMVMYNGKPNKNPWPHARTEFYATGLGWVPADPAGAIRSGRKTQGLEFFGNDNGDFLTHHIDTDIVLDTYFGSKSYEWMMDPGLWEIGGGSLDGNTIKIDVTVESENLNLTDVLERLKARPANSTTAPAKKQSSKTSKKGR